MSAWSAQVGDRANATRRKRSGLARDSVPNLTDYPAFPAGSSSAGPGESSHLASFSLRASQANKRSDEIRPFNPDRCRVFLCARSAGHRELVCESGQSRCRAGRRFTGHGSGTWKSRTGWTLDCHFVGRRVKSEKPLRSSSLPRPINTARDAPCGRSPGPAASGRGHGFASPEGRSTHAKDEGGPYNSMIPRRAATVTA